jgi:hypothetical protein
MEYKYYDSANGNLTVAVRFPPTGGVGIQISTYSGERWVTRFDSLVFADSYHEAMTGALYDAVGMDYEVADWQCREWGIVTPEEVYENIVG